MKTRCLIHIDLRVKDMEVAKKVLRKILAALGFVHESPGEDFHTFYAAGGRQAIRIFWFLQRQEPSARTARA